MFWGTWVCAVKCTIDCAPIHIKEKSQAAQPFLPVTDIYSKKKIDDPKGNIF